MYAWGILCPGQEEYYPKTMGTSIILGGRERESHVMRGDFDSYIEAGGKAFGLLWF